MKDKLLKRAESSAETAALRAERTCLDAYCATYTVEDELIWCIFYLWAAENLDE